MTQTEVREIKYKGEWHRVGDMVDVEVKSKFLFWIKSRTERYQIQFVGIDCSAMLDNGEEKIFITGDVREV